MPRSPPAKRAANQKVAHRQRGLAFAGIDHRNDDIGRLDVVHVGPPDPRCAAQGHPRAPLACKTRAIPALRCNLLITQGQVHVRAEKHRSVRG